MMAQRLPGLRSMRSRILAVFLSVTLAVFVVVITAFNVMVSRYITSTATAHLSSVVDARPGDSADGTTDVPDISGTAAGPLNTPPAVFLLDPDYSVVMPEGSSTADSQTAADLAALLKARDIPLSEVHNLRLASDGSVYYVSCVPDAAGAGYLVFYVDVTGIVHFANSVNFRLLVIMLVAMLLVFVSTAVIARRVTRPLRNLTTFARRIGEGDFSPYPEEFKDREIATLADSMNRTAHQLEVYDKDQKTFFQNASHELRTPLMVISSHAEGIACGIMEPVPASQTVLKEVGRLTEMVEDLLSVSRLDSITKETSTVACDVPALLAAAADEQRQVAEDRGLTFVLDLDGSVAPVQGNDKTLHRAFSNLVANAVRYARSTITLSCAEQGDGVVVTVTDDGPGIEPADLPHIFERFYKGADGNHGIGLAVVRSVAELHGGTVDVRSDGVQTVFSLTVPRSRAGRRPA